MSPDDPPVPNSAQAWSDELALIIWRQDIAERLAALGAWLGYPAGKVPPPIPTRFADLENRDKGLKVQLHYPFSDRAQACDPTEWTISDLVYDAARAPLPFGLDAQAETPDTAQRKLSDDRQAFPSNVVSYFLDDGRVVAITFLPTHVGIAQIKMTRIGGTYA